MVLGHSYRRARGALNIATGGFHDVPDSLSRLSIRPNRFSRPSIYLALVRVSESAPNGIKCRVFAYPLGGFLFFSTCVNTHSVL